MTADRRAAAAILALDSADLLDTLAWVVDGLDVAERRRLLNRLRMREDRAQNAHETPTQRPLDAHASPRTDEAVGAARTERPLDAHTTPTGRPLDAHKGGKGVSPSSDLSPSPLPLALLRTPEDPTDPPRERAREAAPTGRPLDAHESLPDGAHPEDADHVLFARAAGRAYTVAQRSGSPFPAGVMTWRDQQRLRESWPRLVLAARDCGEAVEAYVERSLGSFLAGSKRATWILWLHDPSVGDRHRAPPLAGPEAFEAGADSDEEIAKLVGAQ